MDLVSIIIPTYKNIDKLPFAIKSVVTQTYQNIEIIIVDDNNPNDIFREKTKQIVESYSCKDKRIKYIQNINNSERSFSRNNGAKNSNGDFLMFLDNDDEFFPNKVADQLELLKKYDDTYGFSYSNFVRCKNGKILVKNSESKTGQFLDDSISRNLFIHPGSNLMIRRKVFFEVGGFDETMNINEDIDLVNRMFEKYKIVYCSKLGLKVNIHSNAICNFDFEEKTVEYLKKEKEIINALSKERIVRIRKIIGLQLYRFYLKNSRKRKIISKDYNLDFKIKVKYIFYLANRFFRKAAYGFKL